MRTYFHVDCTHNEVPQTEKYRIKISQLIFNDMECKKCIPWNDIGTQG